MRIAMNCLLSAFIWLACAVDRADAADAVVVSATTEAALGDALQQIAKRRAMGESAHLTLALPGGTYRLTHPLRIDRSHVGEGLTIQPTDGAQVVLSGARQLDAPQRDADGNWRYQLPSGWRDAGVPGVLIVDGQLSSPARWPNEGYLRIEQALPDRRSGFEFRVGDLPEPLSPASGVLDVVLLHDWSSSRLPVASVDFGSRVLRTVGPIGAKAKHYAIDNFERQPRYYLEGHPALADRPGEWFIDLAASAVVVVADPESESWPTVELPLTEQLVVAAGDDSGPLANLTIRSILFTGTRFAMPPGGMACVQAAHYESRRADGSLEQGSRIPLSSAVQIEIATNCLVDNCRFSSLGNSGLLVGSRTRGSRVDNCRFEAVGGNGVNLGEDNSRRVAGQAWFQSAPGEIPTGNSVSNCQFERCGRLLPGAVAIWGGLHRRLDIGGNHIADCPYTGISLGWIWNPTPTPAGENRIHGNHIMRVMQTLSDGGGVYTLGNQPGSLIESNVIEDVQLNLGRAESNGMFLDEGTTGFTVRRNTFRNIARSPVRFHKAEQNTVTNNAWELATPDTPPVRFNNTPEENITIEGNRVLAGDGQPAD